MKTDWNKLLSYAVEIVKSYDTGVTLRQLFYRLVAVEMLPNTRSAYTQLSARTATGRREGWFPDLIDRTRNIHEHPTFSDPEQAKHWLSKFYRIDRTEGQEFSIYLGVEKHGIVEQLNHWFGHYGLPILSLGGYSSETYTKEVRLHTEQQGRTSVLIYAGDLDASGEDIDRDFCHRSDCFDKVVRIALTSQQIEEYKLPPQPGKATDTRSNGFIERHGKLIQVELDALQPEVLRSLYNDAIMQFFDLSMFEAQLEREAHDRESLRP